MAFLSNDIANTRTLLHEAIPVTGSIVSGTYSEENIKTYGHGMFSSVYDYPFLSSSANHIFDTTAGYSSVSSLSGSSPSPLPELESRGPNPSSKDRANVLAILINSL